METIRILGAPIKIVINKKTFIRNHQFEQILFLLITCKNLKKPMLLKRSA